MTAPLPTYQPIQDIELEDSVIATLLSSRVMHKVEHILTPECFYDGTNRCIYVAIRQCYQDGRDYDMQSVRQELKATPGNAVSDYDLVRHQDTGDSGEVARHALILQNLAARRKLWAILKSAEPCTHSIQIPLNDTLTRLNDSILELLSEGNSQDFIVLRDSIVSLKQTMRLNQQNPTASMGLLTGIPAIDDYGGLTRGSLTVLAARPGHGKSAMALQWAARGVREQGWRVAYFSFEMAHDELTSRLLSSYTHIAPHVLLRKPVTEHQYEAVEFAERRLAEGGASSRLIFEHKTTVRFDEIRAHILRLCNTGGLDAIVIDYMQLFSKATKRRDDTDATFYGNIARELKNMALQLNIAVVALSQLNRGAADGDARNSNLRGSGEIEEAADNIVILDQPGIDNRQYTGRLAGQDTRGTASLAVTKSRNFRVGEVSLLAFKGEEMSFAPIACREIRKGEDEYGGLFE